MEKFTECEIQPVSNAANMRMVCIEMFCILYTLCPALTHKHLHIERYLIRAIRHRKRFAGELTVTEMC